MVENFRFQYDCFAHGHQDLYKNSLTFLPQPELSKTRTVSILSSCCTILSLYHYYHYHYHHYY